MQSTPSYFLVIPYQLNYNHPALNRAPDKTGLYIVITMIAMSYLALAALIYIVSSDSRKNSEDSNRTMKKNHDRPITGAIGNITTHPACYTRIHANISSTRDSGATTGNYYSNFLR